MLLSGYTKEVAEISDLVAMGARFASKPLGARDPLRLLAYGNAGQRRWERGDRVSP